MYARTTNWYKNQFILSMLILVLLTLAKAWTTPNRRIVRKTSFSLICSMLVNAIEVKDLWAEKVRPFFNVVTSFIPRGSAGARI